MHFEFIRRSDKQHIYMPIYTIYSTIVYICIMEEFHSIWSNHKWSVAMKGNTCVCILHRQFSFPQYISVYISLHWVYAYFIIHMYMYRYGDLAVLSILKIHKVFFLFSSSHQIYLFAVYLSGSRIPENHRRWASIAQLFRIHMSTLWNLLKHWTHVRWWRTKKKCTTTKE